MRRSAAEGCQAESRGKKEMARYKWPAHAYLEWPKIFEAVNEKLASMGAGEGDDIPKLEVPPDSVVLVPLRTQIRAPSSPFFATRRP